MVEAKNYESQYTEGQKLGQGATLYRKDGSKWYEGECKDGKPHGQGTGYLESGGKYAGEW